MTDKMIRYVDIELDKPRKMRFNLAAWCKFYELTNINILVDPLDLTKLNPVQLRALIYSCLITDDSDLKPAELANIIYGFSLKELYAKLLLAIEVSSNTEKPEVTDNRPLAVESHG